MTKIEHLLVCLSEECSEIQKNCSKALRFGLNDCKPRSKKTNEALIAEELSDLQAIVEMLKGEGLHLQTYQHSIDKKQTKVLKYIEYARNKGLIEEVKCQAKKKDC